MLPLPLRLQIGNTYLIYRFSVWRRRYLLEQPYCRRRSFFFCYLNSLLFECRPTAAGAFFCVLNNHFFNAAILPQALFFFVYNKCVLEKNVCSTHSMLFLCRPTAAGPFFFCLQQVRFWKKCLFNPQYSFFWPSFFRRPFFFCFNKRVLVHKMASLTQIVVFLGRPTAAGAFFFCSIRAFWAINRFSTQIAIYVCRTTAAGAFFCFCSISAFWKKKKCFSTQIVFFFCRPTAAGVFFLFP